MSEKITFTNTASVLKEAAPKEKGPRKRYTFTGLSYGKVTDFEEKSFGSGNSGIEMTIECADGDHIGVLSKRTLVLTGTAKNGEPNANMFLELWKKIAESEGRDAEAALQELQDKEMSLTQVGKLLKGKMVYYRVEAERKTDQQGREFYYSTIKSFVPRATFDKATASGTARTPVPTDLSLIPSAQMKGNTARPAVAATADTPF